MSDDRLDRIEGLLRQILAEQDLMLRALADMGQRLAIDDEITRDLRQLATVRRDRDTIPAGNGESP